MFMHEMPDCLTWHNADIMSVVYKSYVDLLCERLSERAVLVDHWHPDAAAALRELVDGASDESLARVLCAPETSWRLLWRSRGSAKEALEFVADGIERHEYSIGRRATCKPGWGVLGNFQILENGEVRTPFQICGMMPIDVESPFSYRADLGSGPEINELPRASFSLEEADWTRRSLKEASDLITKSSPLCGEFVNRFTQVLVVCKHPTENSFSSGTTGQFIGRSLISNALDGLANVSDLADALVHEAMHALLFMQERRKKWVLVEALYDPTPRAISPWTGRQLPLRAFLQAAFIWYGLLNFWLRVSVEGGRSVAVTDRDIELKINASAAGFFAGPLLDRIEEFRRGIADDILDAVGEVQERVVGALGPAFGARPT